MKMMTKMLSAAALLIPLVACSQSNPSTPEKDVSVAIKKTFATQFPDREVISVENSPVQGVYEVVVKGTGGKGPAAIVYSDPTGSHLFVGDLIDTAKRASVTEQKLAELNKITVDVKSLPLDKAIKEVHGNGSRTLYVFSDPDCPFCKVLERDSLAKLDNVTIYTFLYPLTQLHPDAERKAKAIWCSSDKAKTWSSFMREGKALPKKVDCENPIAANQKLGAELGVQGTPAIIFANGELVGGAIPAAQIEEKLKALK